MAGTAHSASLKSLNISGCAEGTVKSAGSITGETAVTVLLPPPVANPPEPPPEPPPFDIEAEFFALTEISIDLPMLYSVYPISSFINTALASFTFAVPLAFEINFTVASSVPTMLSSALLKNASLTLPLSFDFAAIYSPPVPGSAEL